MSALKPPKRPLSLAPDYAPGLQVKVPTLRWPAQWWESGPPSNTDGARFRVKSELGERGAEGSVIASVEFYDALINARQLYIMDKHFDRVSGYAPLYRMLKTNTLSRIWILSSTNKPDEVETMSAELYRKLVSQLPGDTTPDVQWRDRSLGGFPLHDRFAIVDDELWHFGATVGGAHRSVNAFSRGWDAEETHAIEYFMDLWGTP
ncbi:hypothetical protein QZM19_22225 [Burkholderia multivorans]|uniref:hypothetical protein n=1 Tax=Burkholderia multivorans TaxID=87883 RepID=UPI0011B1D240|nr:hypothetical protein [Burkholderia multivorans]MDN7478493.1 hypothetical protein [Burkholderia multivorans]MDN7866097.1 hypothetical protein [Burkholderia multivorans]